MNRRSMLAALVLGLLAGSASGQTSGGAILGRVTDDAGSPLSGVAVTAANFATRFERSVRTGVDGRYRFPSLPLGTYDITAELKGYATVTARKAVNRLALPSRADLRMRRTAVEEEVTVTAPVRRIENTPAIGLLVERDLLAEVPLRDRRFEELAVLAPFAGLLSAGFETIADGVTSAGELPIDAVEQMNVTTGQQPAEWGRTTGTVLLVRTRSGTNAWNGDAFGSWRRWDRRWEWGASAGGPLVRDRAHVFAAADDQPDPSARRLFAAASGDLSSHFVEANFTTSAHRPDSAIARDLWHAGGTFWNDLVVQRASGANELRESLAGTAATRSVAHEWTIGGSALEDHGHALFAQDAIRTGKFTTYAGLRYESSLTDPLSPRFGVTYDVNGSGRNLLRAAAGRFLDPATTQISLGYSWQFNPWLALNADALRLEPRSGDAHDALAVSGQARFSTFLALEGSYTFTGGSTETEARHRVGIGGIIRVPGQVWFSGLVRYRSATAVAQREALSDLRVGKTFVLERTSLAVFADILNLLNQTGEVAAGPGGRSERFGMRISF